MQNEPAAKKISYDYWLILATVAVLFVISAISVFAMFYFKWAQVQNMAPALKIAYMDRMNTVVAPFIAALILLVGVCVPKRLLPVEWLNRFAVGLLAGFLGLSLWRGAQFGLLAVLIAAGTLQAAVLALAVSGSARLHFTRSGYWLRVGSSLIHLGLILFVLDLFLHRQRAIHLALFWLTTLTTVTGMAFCFWSDWVAGLLGGKKDGGSGITTSGLAAAEQAAASPADAGNSQPA